MKALLVLVLMLMAAATALAYGRPESGADVAMFVEESASALATEPVFLLLSGGVLLALAGLVRRLPV